jgi:hypothetical protein
MQKKKHTESARIHVSQCDKCSFIPSSKSWNHIPPAAAPHVAWYFSKHPTRLDYSPVLSLLCFHPPTAPFRQQASSSSSADNANDESAVPLLHHHLQSADAYGTAPRSSASSSCSRESFPSSLSYSSSSALEKAVWWSSWSKASVETR